MEAMSRRWAGVLVVSVGIVGIVVGVCLTRMGSIGHLGFL